MLIQRARGNPSAGPLVVLFGINFLPAAFSAGILDSLPDEEMDCYPCNRARRGCLGL